MKKSLLSLIPFLTACAGEPPQNIGVENNRLVPCPESPNCVSSFESDETHAIEPLNAGISEIQQVLANMDDANIVNAESDYLYAEFTTALMGFVDDVEFLQDRASGVTHVRSASRLGYSDMGANRSRIERIRTALTQN